MRAAQALDGARPWSTRYRYATDPGFHLDAIFRAVDLRGDPAAIEALAREERNRPLDLFTDFPVTFTLAATAGEACVLFVRQHHAIADGRAFIALLADFAVFLNLARAGLRPAPEPLAPVGRRSEAEALGLSRSAQRRATIAGYGVLARIHARSVLRPLKPLLQNVGADYTGENGTVHWVVPDSALEPWNAARKRLGVSLNSLLTGALLVALQRWHRAMELPVGRTSALVLMETRPRAGDFLSFANHLAFPEVEVRLDRIGTPAEAMALVQAQMDRERKQRTALKRLLAERSIAPLLPLAELQRIALDSKRPAQSTSFSNLIPLEFPRLGGEGWKVDDVLITTTVQPRTGISLTVIRYEGRLFFNFNYKGSVVTREETAALAAQFAAVLAEVSGSEADGRGSSARQFN